jgi:hypothetical protein
MSELSPANRKRFDTQGFVNVPDAPLAEVGPWMGFAFGMCAAIALVGVVLDSSAILWGLIPFALLGVIFPVHPFDLIYNRGIRHIRKTGPVPRRGAPVRFDCGLATAWLAVTGWLFYTGANLAGYILGGALVAVATLVATTNICIPSMIYGALFGRPKRAGESSPQV